MLDPTIAAPARDEPAWLVAARRDLGVVETTGAAATPRIVAYYRDVGQDWVTSDEVAWCAAFAGACLERQGIRSTRSLRARSYLDWGTAIDYPRVGAIAVFARGGDPRLGHVGFVAGSSTGHLQILGGNQHDAVSIVTLPKSRLLGMRWPAVALTAYPSSIFETALAHVLLQEGGWSNDPRDPGGPTQRGITLATYAAHTGETITAANRDRLIATLAAIPDAVLHDIYRQRYWQRAACDQLPAAIAAWQFDTAVNQGPVTAIRLLQEAAGTSIDGEFGPLTAMAIASSDLAQLITRAADLRRARYRRTRNFAVFGKGWLARVAATERLALSLLTPLATKETEAMTQQPKWWGRSLTIWGAVITALSTVLPLLGPLLGIDLSAADILRFGDQMTQVLQIIGGILGTILTIYGRVRADAPLERRTLQLSL